MMMDPVILLQGLPGAERILAGLRDYRANRRTADACLVRIARHRLARAGLLDATPNDDDDGAELELYGYFAASNAQAHSHYNALLRELVSFEHALDHRLKLRSPVAAPPPGCG